MMPLGAVRKQKEYLGLPGSARSSRFPAGFRRPGYTWLWRFCSLFTCCDSPQSPSVFKTSSHLTETLGDHRKPQKPHFSLWLNHSVCFLPPDISLYKLELRGFPLLLLLKELFPGCPHFPLPGLAALQWLCTFDLQLPAFFFNYCYFFKKRDFQLIFWFLIIWFLRSYWMILQISPVPLVLWIYLRVEMHKPERISVPAYGSLCQAERLFHTSLISSQLGISNLVPLYAVCSHSYARPFESFAVIHLLHPMDQTQADFYKQTSLQDALGAWSMLWEPRSWLCFSTEALRVNRTMLR